MIFGYGDPVTVITRTVSGTDSLGNDTYTATTKTVPGAFAPEGSFEVVQGQQQVTTQPIVYLPAGTAVEPADQIVVRGKTYEVDASPNEYVNPFTGWAPGVAVKLKRVTG